MGRVDGGKLEAAEDKQRADIHPQSSDLRNLTERRPDDWAQAVACNVEGQTQGCWDLGDAEASHDIHQTGRVDGGANVYGKGEEADLEGNEESLCPTPVARVLPGVSVVSLLLGSIHVPADHLVHTSQQHACPCPSLDLSSHHSRNCSLHQPLCASFPSLHGL